MHSARSRTMMFAWALALQCTEKTRVFEHSTAFYDTKRTLQYISLGKKTMCLYKSDTMSNCLPPQMLLVYYHR